MKKSLIVKIMLWWYVITLLCWLIFGLIDNEKWFDFTLSKYAYGSFGILFLIFFGICIIAIIWDGIKTKKKFWEIALNLLGIIFFGLLMVSLSYWATTGKGHELVSILMDILNWGLYVFFAIVGIVLIVILVRFAKGQFG